MKCGCSNIFFLNTINLICRSTDISKCFRGSLRFRDNESRLYSDLLKMCMSYFCRSNYNHVKTCVLKSSFTEPQNTMSCQQFRCSFIKQGYIKLTYPRTKLHFLLYFSMNYRDFSVKSKLIISLFQTVKLSLSISLFQKIGFS